MDAQQESPGQIVLYNQEAASSSIIKIGIPAAAVTAATIAGSITYTATNMIMGGLSSATEMGINGVGFLAAKTTGAFISPIIGSSISIGTTVAATAAKESIQAKGKIISLATSSIAGASAAIGVTAVSYAASAATSIMVSTYDASCQAAVALQNWVRAKDYDPAQIEASPVLDAMINSDDLERMILDDI